MKQVEADSLLKCLVIIDLHIGNLPELMDFRLLGLKLFLPSALNSFFQFFFANPSSLPASISWLEVETINFSQVMVVFAGTSILLSHTACLFSSSVPKTVTTSPAPAILYSLAACHCHAALQGRALVIQHPILSLKLVHMQSATKRTVTDQRIGLSGMILHISIQMGTNADLPRKIHRRNLDLLVHPWFLCTRETKRFITSCSFFPFGEVQVSFLSSYPSCI